MARLKENPWFTGTYENIVVYTRWGQYYIRTKSTLSGQRVKKRSCFQKDHGGGRDPCQGFEDRF